MLTDSVIKDFVYRKVQSVEESIGVISPGRKKALRSFYTQMARYRREHEDANWYANFLSNADVPEEVREFEKVTPAPPEQTPSEPTSTVYPGHESSGPCVC